MFVDTSLCHRRKHRKLHHPLQGKRPVLTESGIITGEDANHFLKALASDKWDLNR